MPTMQCYAHDEEKKEKKKRYHGCNPYARLNEVVKFPVKKPTRVAGSILFTATVDISRRRGTTVVP